MEFLTIRQEARETGLPEHRIRQWQKMGILPGFQAGTRYYVNHQLFVKQLSTDEFGDKVREITNYIRGGA